MWVLYNKETLKAGQPAKQVTESQAWSISMVIHKITLTETSVFSLYYSHLCILCIDGVLKSRDITLLTKVHLVKVVVFPLVIYECESWTIKKAEFQRTDAFQLWCWGRLLRVPLDCKKIKPVNPKENQSWIFIGRTDAEAETPALWPPDAKNWLLGKDPDDGKDWRQEEKGTTEDEMVGWHHRLNGHEFEQTLGDGEGQGSLECCSPWGYKELDMI